MPSEKRFWPSGITAENVWHDARTGMRLAPGAIQNWPTKQDEKQILYERRMMVAAMREFELKKKMAVNP